MDAGDAGGLDDLIRAAGAEARAQGVQQAEQHEVASFHEQPGETIDRYRLVRELGEGGMGVVWLAEQFEPVRREVALKVVKLGMDTRAVLGRFDRERQVLAQLDHPSIATVFDGGTTSSGRPYFVMELVEGAPVTAALDEVRAPVRRRVEVVLDICSAIAHAHRRGVIHRDLKASNILLAALTPEEARPIPKVIDFGIAKATSGDALELTLHTQENQVLGSLGTMAPEQAAGGAIDERTDVFGLGAVLYELLVGRPPFLRAGGTTSLEDALRTALEARAQRPSRAALDASLCEKRSTTREELRSLLARDLDWVVLKALERDPARRYASVTALAEDLERFLRDEPVLASSPSLGYRAMKFARRNRVLVGGVAATLVALSAGLVGTVVAARRAIDAERAGRRTLYHAEMLLACDASESVGGIRRVRELCDNWIPQAGDPDQRGWEWDYLSSTTRDDALVFEPHDATCGVDWHPDGNTLAVATVRSLVTHDARTGDELFRWDYEGEADVLMEGVRFSPADPSVVVLAGLGAAVAVDLDDSKKLWEYPIGYFGAPTWTDDGARLAGFATFDTKGFAAFDNKNRGAVILDGLTGRELVRSAESVCMLAEASFDGARGVLTAAGPGTPPGSRLLMLDAETLTVTWSVDAHEQPPTTVVLSPDRSTLASSSYDGAVHLWAPDGAQPTRTLCSGGEPIRGLAWHPEGSSIASCSEDTRVRVWDVETGQLIVDLNGHTGPVDRVDWSPDGTRLASTSRDGTVRIWRPFAPVPRRTLALDRGRGFGAMLSPVAGGDRMLVGTNDDSVVVDFDTFTASAPLGESNAFMSGDGHLRVSAGSQGNGTFEATIHREDTDEELRTYGWSSTPGDWLVSAAWSPDSKALALVNGRRVHVLDPLGAKEDLEIPYPEGAHSRSAAWSPDGRWLAATCNYGHLLVIDLETRSSVVHEALLKDHASCCAWEPSGARIACGNDAGDVLLCDAPGGTVLAVLTGHIRQVRGCAWHPTEPRLATGAADGTVKLWDTNSHALAASFNLGAPVLAVSWKASGDALVACDDSGTLHVLDASIARAR